MTGIPIFDKHADDFSTNGLGLLTPLEAEVEEQAAGMYELTLVQPIDKTNRWAQIRGGNIIKVPVPVRESPIYEAEANDTGETVVVRDIWKVVKTSVGVWLRTGPGTGYKALKHYPNDTRVVKMGDVQNSYMPVVLVNGGAEGWMHTRYLEQDTQETETITPEKPGNNILQLEQSREQLFRIYSVETDTEDQTVTTKAMHVFYDQRGNLIDAEYEPSNVDVATVAAEINAKLLETNPITWKIQKLTGDVSGTFSYKTPVEAYLDPDEGIIRQTKALLVRDNFNAYLLPDSIRDRGVTVRRKKNLLGVRVNHDESNIVTRVIPVGKNKKGEPLYLDGKKYVERKDVEEGFDDSIYTAVMTRRIEYDVSVGTPNDENKGKVFKNETEARAELKRLAGLEFTENGIDLPSYGMEVDFVLLQNAPEYANYASLQAVHLYDTVTVIDELIGISAKLRVTGYKWNVLTKQYTSITLGELLELKQTVYNFNLANGSVSGNKIMTGTADGSILRNASIQYAKIAVAAIEQLTADSVTAVTGRFDELLANRITSDMIQAGQVTADKIAAGAVTAKQISAGAVTAEKIDAGAVTADKIQAKAIDATHIASKTITGEQIAAGAIVSGDGIIGTGAIGTAQIADGSITDAKIVNLTANKITSGTIDAANVNIKNLKADNITAGTLNGAVIPVLGSEKIEDGAISGVKIIDGAVTTDKIDDGAVTAAKIVSEAVTTDKLAANSVTANKIVSGAITTDKIGAAAVTANKIDVDDLFADITFTNKLVTSNIVGDKNLTIIAGEATDAKKTAEQTQTDLNATKNDLSSTKTDLAATKNDLSSTQSDLNATKNNLSGTQADLAATKTDLSSTKTDLAATKTDLSSTKTDLAATKDKIDNLQIGGRNLFTNTLDFGGSIGNDWNYALSYWQTSAETYRGFTVKQNSTAWNGLSQPIDVAVGEEYTLSAWIKRSAGATVIFYCDKASEHQNGTSLTDQTGTDWRRVRMTFLCTAAGSATPRFENSVEGETLYICGMQLETGNIATDWSPAPQDSDDEIIFATPYDSEEPPAAAPETGKVWIDRGTTPPIFRRWKGLSVSTEREYTETSAENPFGYWEDGASEGLESMVSTFIYTQDSGTPGTNNPLTLYGIKEASIWHNAEQKRMIQLNDGRLVYGGEIDWVRGKWKQTHYAYLLTGDETFQGYTQANGSIRWEYAPPDAKASNSTSKTVCSHFQGSSAPLTGGNNQDEHISVHPTNPTYGGHVFLRCDRFSTEAEFKAWRRAQYEAGTPVIIVFPLAEPIEHSFEPVKITMQSGWNEVSAAREPWNGPAITLSTALACSGWDTINSAEDIRSVQQAMQLQQNNAQAAIDELRTAVAIDNEGVHVRKVDNNDVQLIQNEVLITQKDVNIVSGGVRNSTFGSGYVRLLDMIIRVGGGGLIIEAAEV